MITLPHDDLRKLLEATYREGIACTDIKEMEPFITSKLSEMSEGEDAKDELIKVLEGYIEFLDKQSLPFIQFAGIHGMKVSNDVYEIGRSHRSIITILKMKILNHDKLRTTGNR